VSGVMGRGGGGVRYGGMLDVGVGSFALGGRRKVAVEGFWYVETSPVLMLTHSEMVLSALCDDCHRTSILRRFAIACVLRETSVSRSEKLPHAAQISNRIPIPFRRFDNNDARMVLLHSKYHSTGASYPVPPITCAPYHAKVSQIPQKCQLSSP